jgi:hypothetical protein
MTPPTPTELCGRVWIEDRDWRCVASYSGKKCRFRGCAHKAVAEMARQYQGGKRHWWAYCEEHLYGRRVGRDRVETEVSADSLAAKRGFAGGRS